MEEFIPQQAHGIGARLARFKLLVIEFVNVDSVWRIELRLALEDDDVVFHSKFEEQHRKAPLLDPPLDTG